MLPRLCFIHIPKCSGTSVFKYLLDLYGRHSVFFAKKRIPFDEDYHVQDPLALLKYRLYPGHIYWDTVAHRLPSDTATFTLLRDPADRILSLFFFWRGMKESVAQAYGEKAHEAITLTKKLDIIDWLQCDHPFIRGGRMNAYVKYLVSGKVLHRGQPDEILEEGRRNMDACIHAGTTENAEANLAVLCSKLGAPKRASLPWLNASKRSQLEPAEHARIHAILQETAPLDFLLHEHAKTIENRALINFKMKETNEVAAIKEETSRPR